MTRPPKPRTAGLPGWCNVVSVQTASTFSGVCGLGFDSNIAKGSPRFHLTQPGRASTAAASSRQTRAAFLSWKVAVRCHGRCLPVRTRRLTRSRRRRATASLPYGHAVACWLRVKRTGVTLYGVGGGFSPRVSAGVGSCSTRGQRSNRSIGTGCGANSPGLSPAGFVSGKTTSPSPTRQPPLVSWYKPVGPWIS